MPPDLKALELCAASTDYQRHKCEVEPDVNLVWAVASAIRMNKG
ncbi:hypothetical protein RABR111495_19070 [Rahnella bruchi]